MQCGVFIHLKASSMQSRRHLCHYIYDPITCYVVTIVPQSLGGRCPAGCENLWGNVRRSKHHSYQNTSDDIVQLFERSECPKTPLQKNSHANCTYRGPCNCLRLTLVSSREERATDIETIDRVIDVPFPDERLATVALKALSVDKELSPLVTRTFEVVSPADTQANGHSMGSSKSVLQVTYRASTNRMLRVSVNGFFESLKLVVQVMEDLDVDVYNTEIKEELTKVQGLGEAAVGV